MKTIFQCSCSCPAYQNIPILYYAILDFKDRVWTGYWRPYKYLTPIQAIKGLYLLAWSHWWYCYGVCHIQIDGVILSQFLEGLTFGMVIMKHLNVHKLRRCINHAYRIYISGMHSHHVIIDFRSLMICIQDSVLVWLLWIWYGLIQVYFQMQYTERVHPLNRFGDSSMVLHAQLQGPFTTKE